MSVYVASSIGGERQSARHMTKGLASGMAFAVGGLVIALLFPDSSEYSDLDRMNYFLLSTAYLLFAFLITIAVAYRDISLFEPLTLISVLFFCTFVLYPLRDVLMHDMVSHGKDVSKGCCKATMIVAAAYSLLHIFYYTGKDRVQYANAAKRSGEHAATNNHDKNTTLMLGVWVISFLASIAVMLQSGMSFLYLFSLGLRGEYAISEEHTLLLFLSNFGISLVTAWVYLLYNARSFSLKVVTSLLTWLYALARMSRWLILVSLVAPFVYYFSLTRKRVSNGFVLAIAVFFLLVAAWMQIYRYDFRRGATTDFSFEWDIATLMGPFKSDFTTYKTFYGMVLEIPSSHSYYLGKSTILNFFVMMIPRAVWPGKPTKATVSEIVSISVNSSAAEAGKAFYNIGEYYADFGPFGVFFLISVFGYSLGRFLEPKRNSRNVNDLLAFSIMFPLLFQWTARGNTGANIWLTIFAMFPVELLRLLGDRSR